MDESKDNLSSCAIQPFHTYEKYKMRRVSLTQSHAANVSALATAITVDTTAMGYLLNIYNDHWLTRLSWALRTCENDCDT